MTPPPDEHRTPARVCVLIPSGAEQENHPSPAEVQAAAAARLGAAVSVLRESLKATAQAAKPTLAIADVALLSLESPEAALTQFADLAKALGVTVALHISAGRRVSRDLLCLIDILIVGEPHAPGLVGETSLNFDEQPGPHDDLRARFQQLGVRTVVVTLGKHGAWFLHERSSRFVPAYPAIPTDPSGAGDAFVGTFAARWAEHQVGGIIDEASVHDTVCWACAAGALTTTKPGAIAALPSRSEVIAKLRAISV